MSKSVVTVPGPAAVSRKEHTLWALQRVAPTVGVSNLPVALRVNGHLRWWPLQAAVTDVVRRHAALRTGFPDRDGEPTKVVLEADEVDIDIDVVAGSADLDTQLREYAARPFDVTEAPLLRVGQFVCDDVDVLCIVVHHLVFDATSEGVLVRDLAALYTAYARSRVPDPALLTPVSRAVERVTRDESVAYWRRTLAGVDRTATRLGIGRPDPDDPTFAGGRATCELPDDLHRALGRIARQVRATDNIVALAAFLLLLRLHGAGHDLVVGVPVDARDNHGRDSVGYHVNTVALRLQVPLDVDFAELARRTRDALLEALVHADTPFDVIMPELNRDGSTWRTPLFRHMFNFRPAVRSHVDFDGAPAELIAVDKGLSRLDLEWAVFRTSDRTGVTAVYSTEIHDAESVSRLLQRYSALLASLARDVERPVGELDWWSPDDRRVVAEANRTGGDGRGGTVAAAVRVHAEKAGEAVAVQAADGVVTYADLCRAVDVLAIRLHAAGVRRGAVVALAMVRGPALVTAALATWSLGAAFLPLDPDHPAGRLAFQLTDSRAVLLITDRDVPTEVSEAAPAVLPWPLSADDAGAGSDPPPWSEPEPDAPAYICYTSGSTGVPKGVVVTHANLANVVAHFADELPMRSSGAMLWLTTFAFDISVLEAFLPLATGARLVVAPDEARTDPVLLTDLVRRYDVDVIQATPTTWQLLTADLGRALAGRQVLCGGEALSESLAAALLSHDCALWNVYGPTETTIWSTSARLEDVSRGVHVGVPILNTTVFIADESGRELPPGLPGELCIAGAGVAAGYLERPDLTADRFRVHPRLGRYYRTGDQARWRDDGVLELVGRADRQVKLRAHRIELGEVEAVVQRHPEVRSVVVVMTGEPTSTGRLTAFLLARPRPGLVDDVWAHSASLLPRYSLPSEFIVVDGLPQTVNGKIDHAALARMAARSPTTAPDVDETGGRPSDDLADLLLGLWRQLLGRPDLGPDANFFVNGGHSLLAARLVGKVSSATGRRIPLSMIFESPTPRNLATHLDSQWSVTTVAP